MSLPEIPAHSCVDCGARACLKGGEHPGFCTSENLDPALLDQALNDYQADEFGMQVMRVATPLSDECMKKQWPRLRATIEFAQRMGYKRLGICTCIGFVAESRKLARALREAGFEVYGVACKVGEIMGSEAGFCSTDNDSLTCNPLVQARLLNDAKTDLNIVMGLCVGHDIMFNRYSEAPVTTFMTKDPALKEVRHLAFEE